MDSTTMHPRTDRKTLRQERQKKIALGHKEDDHEDEQNWLRQERQKKIALGHKEDDHEDEQNWQQTM